MLGRNVSRALKKHPPEWFWGDALPVLQSCDGVIANLESPITSRGERWVGWKAFRYRADPAAIAMLSCANIRFVTLANNHILDYGASGLADTLATLDEAGIVHTGAGRDLSEASKPVTMELHGLKIGILAATNTMGAFAAQPDRPGTHHIEVRAVGAAVAEVRRQARAVRAAGASLVVLTLHWGPDMRVAPSHRFQDFAHAVLEAGIDIVHGHSAHVFQGIERRGNGIILYDTGNIVDDYWKFPFRRTFWSLLSILEIKERRAARLRIIPLRNHPGPVSIATGETRAAILERLRSLCEPFSTELRDTAEGVEIALGDGSGGSR